ncbi:hypothetical protein [uncultured Algibacter sp.]|uniref:hypothetical protein n=1 Tax=uncultured Algibacter sp. TaxID=298659 RepID=UPI0032178D79
MGIIQLIIFVIIFIVGLISVISYYQDKGDMKRTQSSLLENLSHERVLTGKEIENIKKIYKINLDRNTPVYSLTGSVGYIVFETNGQGQKEWQIANILIANKSVKILEKKDIFLEKSIMNENEVNPKIDALNKELEADKITEEEAKREANLIFEKYINNKIDFIVANPLKKDKPVYLLSYKNNEMKTPLNLLT